MPLSVHNEIASIANLARTVLSCVDPRQEKTPVQTATLVLICETLIDLAEPQIETRKESQDRTVRQLVAPVETAIQQREEDDHQAKGGEPPKPRRAWG
jgi:hypothetical protein